jgi:hypothetical protein
MTPIEALLVLLNEAKKDRGARYRLLQCERALRAMGISGDDRRTVLWFLEYVDSNGEIYKFYQAPTK